MDANNHHPNVQSICMCDIIIITHTYAHTNTHTHTQLRTQRQIEKYEYSSYRIVQIFCKL